MHIEPIESRLLLSGTGLISGSVYFDVNRNGVREATEVPLKDKRVFADLNKDGLYNVNEPVGVTNRNGNFTLFNLAAGTYTVRLDGASNAVATAPRGGAFTVAINDAEARTGLLFGATATGTIKGQLYDDSSDEGDPNHGGWNFFPTSIPGRIVYADINLNGRFDRGIDRYTRTTESGYTLSVYSGSYQLRAVLMAGKEIQTFHRKGRAIAVTVGSGLVNDVEAPSMTRAPLPTATLGGRVFDDLDNDNALTAGDVVRKGLRVYLDRDGDQTYDNGEPSELTDSRGRYSFRKLYYGRGYAVRVVVPAGQRVPRGGIGASANGTLNNDVPLTRTSRLSGSVHADAHVGESPDDIQVSGIVVYVDLNRDGKRQKSEPRGITDFLGRWELIVPIAGAHTLRLEAPWGLEFDAPETGTREFTIGEGEEISFWFWVR